MALMKMIPMTFLFILLSVRVKILGTLEAGFGVASRYVKREMERNLFCSARHTHISES